MSRSRLRLAPSFIASLLINALVILPVLTEAAEPRVQSLPEGVEIAAPEFEDTPSPPDEVKLGIEESDASTLAWIGYEEYREHMARLAEIDQAQFQVGGASQGGGAPEPTPPAPETTAPTEPQPEPQPQDPAQTQPQAAAPLPEAPPTEAPTPQPTPLPTPLPAASDPNLPAPPPEAPEPEQTPEPTEAPATEDAPEPPATDAPKPPQTPPPTPETPPTPQTPPTTPSPPTPQTPPAPGPPSDTPGPTTPGLDDLPPVENPSDRDSDPTATTPLKFKKMGGPVAAQGLNVRTFKPKLTPFQQMQFGKTNVLAKIDFAKDGKPKAVSMGRLNTRTKRIDWLPSSTRLGRFEEVIQTTLYRWRATGKELDELGPGETIAITFELSFN